MKKNIRNRHCKAMIYLLYAPFCFSVIGQSQNPRAVQRDTQAVQIVSQAITALGGTVAHASIEDAVTTGSCTNAGNTPTNQGVPSHFKWTIAGEEYRYETIHGDSSNVLASGHGRPASSTPSGVKKLSAFQMRPAYHLPGLMLHKELQDARYLMRYMGQKQVDQGMASWVQIAVMGAERPIPVTIQDWYFGADSIPLEVDYFVASESAVNRLAKVTLNFSNYQATNKTVQPGTISATMSSGRKGICTIYKTSINTHPDKSIFDLR